MYAADMREEFKLERPVLVDDPEAGNPVRVAYGSLANMSYVINNRGIVSFRSNWTRAEEIEEVVQSLLAVEGARGEKRSQAMMVHSEHAFYQSAEESTQGMVNLYRITERAGTLEETFGERLEQVRSQLGIGATAE